MLDELYTAVEQAIAGIDGIDDWGMMYRAKDDPSTGLWFIVAVDKDETLPQVIVYPRKNGSLLTAYVSIDPRSQLAHFIRATLTEG